MLQSLPLSIAEVTTDSHPVLRHAFQGSLPTGQYSSWPWVLEWCCNPTFTSRELRHCSSHICQETAMVLEPYCTQEKHTESSCLSVLLKQASAELYWSPSPPTAPSMQRLMTLLLISCHQCQLRLHFCSSSKYFRFPISISSRCLRKHDRWLWEELEKVLGRYLW